MKDIKEDTSEYDWREKEPTHARLRDVIAPALFAGAVGSMAGAYFTVPLLPVYILSVVFIYFLGRAVLGRFKTSTVTAVFLLATCLGFVRGGISGDERKPVVDKTSHRYAGVITREVNGGKLYVDIGDEAGLVLIKARDYPEHKYGERISFTGKLELPEDFRTESGVNFRYRDMLLARGVAYSSNATEIRIISRNGGNLLISKLLDLKDILRNQASGLPEPEGALLRGMLLGGKSELPKDLEQDFITSSLIHIVVLSGANLMLIAAIAIKLFRRWFGFRMGLFVAALFTIFYALMGGLEGATLRALVLALLVFTAHYLHREGHLGRLLLIAVCGMTIANPYLPRDDPSFQLSVLALVGLIYFAPVIEVYLAKTRLSTGVREYIAAILGAQLAVLPLISSMSGQVSPWGFIANFLVLYPLEFVPPLAVSLLLHSFIFQMPLVLMLGYVCRVAHSIASLPFSRIPLAIGLKFLIFTYVISTLWLFMRWRTPQMKPLARFTSSENEKALRMGRVPWSE